MLFSVCTIFVVLLSLCLPVFVEASYLKWSHVYIEPEEEWTHSLIATSDGGYAIAGQTESFGAGDADFWLVKTDSAGNVEWNRTYGGTEGDFAHDLVETSDGGYALVGSTSSFGLHSAVFLVKTDEAGYMEWNKTYDEGADIQGGESLVATPDGGYMLAGYMRKTFDDDTYDFWLIKTDASGNMEWNKTYGGTKKDVARSLVATSDGGYAIAGDTKSFGRYIDFWLIKTDSSGNVEWNRTYGGTDTEHVRSLIVTSDGGFALAGDTHSFDAGYGDFWLVKTDSSGNMEWNQIYGTKDIENAHSLAETLDGGYVIVGETRIFSMRGSDCWLVKTDELGNMEWNQIYRETSGEKEGCIGSSVVATPDGGFAVAGEACESEYDAPDFWFAKSEGADYVPELRTYKIDVWYGAGYHYYTVVVVTNSTLGDFKFGEHRDVIGFTATCPTGTSGYCKILFPEEVEGDRPVYLNGTFLTEGVDYTKTYNGTYTIFEITYGSSADLEITEINTIPEYSSLILPTLLLTFALVIVIYKKRLFSGKF
jgi:hypothetical protein